MRNKPVPVRRSAPSRLSFPPIDSHFHFPTNKDILAAIEEVKANQEAELDEYNKLKRHITFIDAVILDAYLRLQIVTRADPRDFDKHEAPAYDSLPAL